MLISIIIITYNRQKELSELIRNLQKQKYNNKEIIVVDNNSTDDTEVIIKDFTGVNYFKSDKNLGVPGGRNYGVKKATGDILFFIDNDAEIMDGGLNLIADVFNKEPNLGVLAPRINNYFTRELDLSSWVYTIHNLKDKENSFYTFYFVGCAFAVKKDVFDQCGLLWEDLFFMHEEKDFAYRVINKDYLIKYVPDICIYHKVSPENRYNISSRFFEYGTRNTIWIFLRYHPIHSAIIKIFVFVFFQTIASLKSRNFYVMLKSIIAAFIDIKKPLKNRIHISNEKFREIKKLQTIRKDSFVNRVLRTIGIRKYKIT